MSAHNNTQTHARHGLVGGAARSRIRRDDQSGFYGEAGKSADARTWSWPSSHSRSVPCSRERLGRAKCRGMARGQGAKSRSDLSPLRPQTMAGKQHTKTNKTNTGWPPGATQRPPLRPYFPPASVAIQMQCKVNAISGRHCQKANCAAMPALFALGLAAEVSRSHPCVCLLTTHLRDCVGVGCVLLTTHLRHFVVCYCVLLAMRLQIGVPNRQANSRLGRTPCSQRASTHPPSGVSFSHHPRGLPADSLFRNDSTTCLKLSPHITSLLRNAFREAVQRLRVDRRPNRRLIFVSFPNYP